ncbi:hypothetical protein [Chryseobacterium panacisoli]|uniref:hypothetical protein n=1 Tax=Chryseobacterium panacisoli TaxID=1807141 RepID=UPI00155AEE88|nr:hypothetical protein [Chryseobacterium panacisoli]
MFLIQKDVNKHLREFSATKEFNSFKTYDILADAVENVRNTAIYFSEQKNGS